MVSYVCMVLVGLVFLATATIKCLDTRQFLRQVTDYRVIPKAWAEGAALAFVGLECLVGAALLLRLSDFMIPAVMALLVLLAGLTIWGTSTGRVEDCGCYGGFLQVTPRQSILLDIAYLGLLGLAWRLNASAISTVASISMLKLGVVVSLALASVSIAWWSLRHGRLVDFFLLKAGIRWNPGWAKHNQVDLRNGSHFVVFLSKSCPHCERWIPLLNVVGAQSDMPQVLGVISLEGSERETFLAQNFIRFPIASMSRGLMSMKVDAYPTAVLVEDGTISEKWVGRMPPSYVERALQFLESISIGRLPAGTRFSG